jgi:hypothetical protein
MKSENLIHIKFEYDSALESKKDILASEIDLLKMSQRLERYHKNRGEELDIKAKLEKKIKALKIDIGRLQNLLPKIKIPRILKPETAKEEEGPTYEEVVVKQEKPSIESELQEIQRKLSSLQR